GLPAELAFGTDFAGHAADLRGERVELIDHRIDRVLQLQNLPANFDGDFLGQTTIRHSRRDVRDVADLAGEIRGHRVHRVGEILPGTSDTRHQGLPAELAFGADLARHARHLRGEAVELIDHRVDGFLQLQNLALYIDGNLARQIAACHRRGHRSDVADLRGEIGRHRIDRIGEIFPRARHTWDHRLPTEAPVRTDLARHTGHLRGERAELLHHGIGRLLELQNLAAYVDSDLLGQITIRHCNGHIGDVTHLRGQVACHLVDRVGELLPDARHALHLRLAAELALGADLARHARHLR